jgi:hypothetical protein
MKKRLTEEQVIAHWEDYANYMRDFIQNDPNAKHNGLAVEQAKELMAFLSLYKYGSDYGKKFASKWLVALYKNS